MTHSDTQSASSRRNFLKLGLGVAVGATVASVIEVPFYSNQNYQKDQQSPSFRHS